jgi:myo-inositol-1(or 4)-monophosphatase
MMNSAILCDAAVFAAKEAGELLAKGFGTSFSVASKSKEFDNPVTEYDKASEALIFERLRAEVPGSRFLAEESGSVGEKGDVLWIIDPLDGTVNFAHNIPHFCISIAAFVQHQVVVGVVYQPLLKELFIAEKGKGATLNGKKLHVSNTKKDGRCLVTTGFPYNLKENPSSCIEAVSRVLREGIPIRRFGSAALDLSYVAAGRIDAYYECLLHPWDMAAGILLVEEAKGRVSDYADTAINVLEVSPILATNGHLHSHLLEILSPK